MYEPDPPYVSGCGTGGAVCSLSLKLLTSKDIKSSIGVCVSSVVSV